MEQFSTGPLVGWIHTPKGTAHARVLIVHGIGEHSGRHLNTVNALVEGGFEVVRFDLRGAGQSGGERQWIEHFENYVDDTAQVHNWLRLHRSSLPVFLLGHSLGGAIAVNFAARYGQELEGLILSAPAYLVGDAISPVKIAVGRIVERFAPRLRLPKNTDLSAVSRDPEVVKAYEKDPLSSHFNTLRQGAAILDALQEMPRLAEAITIPSVIYHGSHDRIIQLEGSFTLLKALRSQNKELHVLPSGYHEPHNDLDKEHYFTLLKLWLAKSSALTKQEARRPRKKVAKQESLAGQ